MHISFLYCSFLENQSPDFFNLLSKQGRPGTAMPKLQFNSQTYLPLIIRTVDIFLAKQFIQQIKESEPDAKSYLQSVTSIIDYRTITTLEFMQHKNAKNLILLLINNNCFDFNNINYRGLRPLEELCVNREFEFVAELIRGGFCKEQAEPSAPQAKIPVELTVHRYFNY